MTTSGTLVEIEEPGASSPAPAARPHPLAPLQIARNMFGLDYRSLAFMRICMGLLLFWVACINACEMRIFYSDEGVLPRAVFFGSATQEPGFSLYFANGGMVYTAILFALQMILALMFAAGYRTRVAAVGSYILLLSMQNRHPVLLYGADIVLRVSLFWAIFLPVSKYCSLDRLFGRTPPAPDHPFLGVAGIAFIAQFASIYIGGALMKTGRSWQVDHDAVAYALALDVYSRPLGRWISQFPAFTHYLTVSTLCLEMYGPALFVLPIFSKWGRLFGVAFFAGLQIGFGVCMFLGYFGPVMITISLVFLPAFFWDRIAAPIGNFLRRRGAPLAGLLPEWLTFPRNGVAAFWRRWLVWERARYALRIAFMETRPVRFVMALLRDGAVAFLLVAVILWNYGNIPGHAWHLTPGVTEFVYNVGLNQTWDMFSPNPQTIDGWFVVAGTMHNGDTVDLMSGQSPVSYDRPPSVANSYRNRLWMSYLISFWYEGASDPEAFANYMGNQWNESHSYDQQLGSLEIDMMVEHVEPGPKKTDVTRELVWYEWF